MRCKTLDRHLDDYVDGLLPAPLSERVRAHLEGCDECSANAVAAQAANSSMSTWGDLEPSAACFEGLMERLDALPAECHAPVVVHEHVATRTWVRHWPWAAAAALLVWVAWPSAGSPDSTRHHLPSLPTSPGVSLIGAPTYVAAPATVVRSDVDDDIEWRDEVVRPMEVDPDAIDDGLRRRPVVMPPRTQPAGWPAGDLR